jgi:hypothetical protein
MICHAKNGCPQSVNDALDKSLNISHLLQLSFMCLASCVPEVLLDDFLLTYLVFMSTSDLCQALLGQYP